MPRGGCRPMTGYDLWSHTVHLAAKADSLARTAAQLQALEDYRRATPPRERGAADSLAAEEMLERHRARCRETIRALRRDIAALCAAEGVDK